MTTETPTPQIEIKDMNDEEIKQELADHGVTLHHKTGSEKLVNTLTAVRNGTYTAPDPVAPADKVKPLVAPAKENKPTKEATAAMVEATTVTKEQRALKLSRIIVTPNDPNMSAYHGLIFTVGSSSVKGGRMIKKYVPFNNENGWHVPQIIIDQIENAEMQKFRSVTLKNGAKTMQPYITKKFNVQVLPPLTQDEMDALAASQQAKAGIEL